MLFLSSVLSYAQLEKAPVFDSCKNVSIKDSKSCFFDALESTVSKKIVIPKVVKTENFNGTVRVLFTVKTDGRFVVNYNNAPYKSLKQEINRVFAELPKISPATYNSRPIEKQYWFAIKIPFNQDKDANNETTKSAVKSAVEAEEKWTSNISTQLFPEDESPLLIPFTHDTYEYIQADLLHKENQHFAVKPFIYREVNDEINLSAKKEKLVKPATTWLQKKWWNEHFFMVKGKKDNIDYWFTVDPEIDLQLGKDNSDLKYTFNNTRAVKIQGAIGKKFGFCRLYKCLQ